MLKPASEQLANMEQLDRLDSNSIEELSAWEQFNAHEEFSAWERYNQVGKYTN